MFLNLDYVSRLTDFDEIGEDIVTIMFPHQIHEDFHPISCKLPEYSEKRVAYSEFSPFQLYPT